MKSAPTTLGLLVLTMVFSCCTSNFNRRHYLNLQEIKSAQLDPNCASYEEIDETKALVRILENKSDSTESREFNLDSTNRADNTSLNDTIKLNHSKDRFINFKSDNLVNLLKKRIEDLNDLDNSFYKSDDNKLRDCRTEIPRNESEQLSKVMLVIWVIAGIAGAIALIIIIKWIIEVVEFILIW